MTTKETLCSNIHNILEIVNERFDIDLPDEDKGRLSENDFLSINNLLSSTYRGIQEIPELRKNIEPSLPPSQPNQVNNEWERLHPFTKSEHQHMVEEFFQNYAYQLSHQIIRAYGKSQDDYFNGVLRNGRRFEDVIREYFEQQAIVSTPLHIAKFLLWNSWHSSHCNFLNKLCQANFSKEHLIRRNIHMKSILIGEGKSDFDYEPTQDEWNKLLQTDMDSCSSCEKQNRKSRHQAWRPHTIIVDVKRHRIQDEVRLIATASLQTHLRNLKCIEGYMFLNIITKIAQNEIVKGGSQRSIREYHTCITNNFPSIQISQSQRPRKYTFQFGEYIMSFHFDQNVI